MGDNDRGSFECPFRGTVNYEPDNKGGVYVSFDLEASILSAATEITARRRLNLDPAAFVSMVIDELMHDDDVMHDAITQPTQTQRLNHLITVWTQRNPAPRPS